jgi:hypothetical protein
MYRQSSKISTRKNRLAENHEKTNKKTPFPSGNKSRRKRRDRLSAVPGSLTGGLQWPVTMTVLTSWGLVVVDHINRVPLD